MIKSYTKRYTNLRLLYLLTLLLKVGDVEHRVGCPCSADASCERLARVPLS